MLLEEAEEGGDVPKSLCSGLDVICSSGREMLALVNDIKLEFTADNCEDNLYRDVRMKITAVVDYSERLVEEARKTGSDTFVGDLMKIRTACLRLFALIEEYLKFGEMETVDRGDGRSTQAAGDSCPHTARESAFETRQVHGNILVVDDNDLNRDLLARCLKKEGYAVEVAGSGRSALSLLASRRFDLILLDVMMPGMDGYEVCRRLKQDPATRDIPVLFVTAKDDVADEERGLRLGAVDYIVKPFHPPIIKARVQNHISLKMKTDMLETLALIDGLTGIPNRRRFDETLKTEWKRSLRLGNTLAIIMIDIDYFKAYNDNYGHGTGDQCLKTVARALSGELVRPADILARYGGEEFVAVMPDTNGPGALQTAERLCSEVAALRLPHGFSRAADYVTISAGCATLQPAPGQSPRELLKRADEMLYLAKEQGRNRVCG